MLRELPAPLISLLALVFFALAMQQVHAADTQTDTGEQAEAEQEDSDWDWSGYTAEDSTPAEVVVKPTNPEPVVSRDATIAEPDFEAIPRPALAIFENAPEFEVIPSKKTPELHPCTNCHQWTMGDTRPRKLKTPHDNFELKHGLHGKGKFWCMTCHNEDISRGLVTLEGDKVDYNDAYVLCSQCHVHQARDWVYGVHGKRVGNWQGKRQVLNCTACHYQHQPAIKARAPLGGPVSRMGLERPSHWKPMQARKQHHDNAAISPPTGLSFSKAAGDE